jgi:hypothetical protein
MSLRINTRACISMCMRHYNLCMCLIKSMNSCCLPGSAASGEMEEEVGAGLGAVVGAVAAGASPVVVCYGGRER